MAQTLKTFVETHFFVLKQVMKTPQMYAEQAMLSDAFMQIDSPNAIGWQDALPELEALVGAPIDEWHAGHLAQLKGQSLPEWDKKAAFLNGIATSTHLEELQRQAAATAAKMKYAMVRETLVRQAQLYDTPIQEKMKQLVDELYSKSMADPMIFLGHLANRRYAASFQENMPRPSSLWKKSDKTTELVCQLANLTYLEIQKALQSGNNVEQKNVSNSTQTGISMP